MKIIFRKIALVILFSLLFLSTITISTQAQFDQILMGEIDNNNFKLENHLSNFKELEGKLTINKKNKKVKKETNIKYLHQGIKDSNGEKIDQINIELTSEENISSIEFLLNNNQLQELKVDGKVLDSEKAENLKNELFSIFFGPFALKENIQLLNFNDIDNFNLNKEIISGNEINVLTVEADKLDKLNINSAKIKLGSFNDHIMITAYEYQSETTSENYNFKLNKVVLY